MNQSSLYNNHSSPLIIIGLLCWIMVFGPPNGAKSGLWHGPEEKTQRSIIQDAWTGIPMRKRTSVGISCESHGRKHTKTLGFVWICFGGIATGFPWIFMVLQVVCFAMGYFSFADHFTIIDRSRASGWKRGGIKDQVAGESRGAMGPCSDSVAAFQQNSIAFGG